MGFHLVLAIQKHFQKESGVKGHTFFVFDNEEREKMRFTDIILRPPDWSDAYYRRGRRQEQLSHVVDVPYFGDSQDVVLIQLADMASFLLRRYAEVKAVLEGPKYSDEEQRLAAWIGALRKRAISTPIYLKRGRQYAEDLFYQHAPPAIREL